MVNWNTANKNRLVTLWNKGYSDHKLTEIFGAGTYAIAKQRSVMGLVTTKRKKHTRAPKTVNTTTDKMFYAAFYEQDGKNHFTKIDTNNEEYAKKVIKVLMSNKGVSKVILLKPTTKIILEKWDDLPF